MDTGLGTADDPLRTLAAALDRPSVRRVRVGPGRHELDELSIFRPLEIQGVRGATLAGSLFIGASDTHLSDLTLEGALRVGLADGVRLARSTLQSPDAEVALAAVSASLELEEVRVEGGVRAAIQATSSTITLESSAVSGPRAERGLWVLGGRARVSNTRLRDLAGPAIEATEGSTVSVSGAHIGPSRGGGVTATDGAVVELVDSEVRDVGEPALLVRRAIGRTRSSTLAGAGRALAVLGGQATVRGSLLQATRWAALTAEAFADTPPQVTLVGSCLAHGDVDGARVTAGRLEARETRFFGASRCARTSTASAPAKERAALRITGPDAKVRLRESEIDGPRGSGVVLEDDAELELIDSSVLRAGGDGVRIAHVRAGRAHLEGLRISSCAGAALRVVDSADVRVERLEASGCAEGGVLAGDESLLDLARSELAGPGPLLGGWRGSSLLVQSSTVGHARPWSVFVSCSDGSQLVDEGDNRIDGPAFACP